MYPCIALKTGAPDRSFSSLKEGVHGDDLRDHGNDSCHATEVSALRNEALNFPGTPAGADLSKASRRAGRRGATRG